MIELHDLIIPVLAFFSEILGTLSGFGSSTFLIPVAVFFEKFELVLALTAILHCFSNTFKIWFFRKDLDLKLFIKLALPFFVFTGIGALLTKFMSAEHFKVALGIFLIILSIVFFARKTNWQWPPQIGFVLTCLSGLTTGLVGTGGALRGLALAILNLEKNAFVAVSSSIDLGGDFLRMVIYLNNGFMDWAQWHYIPLLGVAAYSGTFIGKALLKRIDQKIFEKFVAGFVFLSGVFMILQIKH
jgi:uncharacterized membrane protein YfcA